MDTHNVSVFAADGRDYITSILFPVSIFKCTLLLCLINTHFQVGSLWPTKLGILLEMESPAHDMQLPLLYSLQHPYDDIKPVLTKHAGTLHLILHKYWIMYLLCCFSSHWCGD